MLRSYAVSLGALAMGVVVLRGALYGDAAGEVALEAIFALAVCAVIGGVAGWMADYLVRDAVEQSFRKRVDWYRQGLIDAGYEEQGSPKDT